MLNKKIKLNNKEYNNLKNIVLEATNDVPWKSLNKAIYLLDSFISTWCDKKFSLNKSQSIKTYRDIIISCDSIEELQETLKSIYDMKRAENVINNDYIIRLTEEVKNDKEFFINECNTNHELYDPEVAEYLNGFKKLNEKFMYLA